MNLKSIGIKAFNSTGITTLSIPKTVVSIGTGAFGDCEQLISITVENGNSKYYAPDGSNAVFQSDTLLFGCKTTTNIPDGITVVAKEAFESCSGLTQITLPNTIKTIGSYAFAWTGLTSITLPSSLETITDHSFYSCSKLTEVVSFLETPLSISNSVFNGISGNAVLKIPIGTKNAYLNNDVWPQAFSSIIEFDTKKFTVDGICYLVDEDNPNSVTVIADENPYQGTNYTIPPIVSYYGQKYSVISIDKYAFKQCANLQTIVLPPYIKTIGQEAFYQCKKLAYINLPESLTKIEAFAFEECKKLTSIKLPEFLEFIGNNAFFETNIDSITIPKYVKEIGSCAFAYCENLAFISVDKDNVVYNSKDSCNAIIKGDILIAGCMNTIIPDGIIKIGHDAFRFCTRLKSITIPQSVKIIDDNAFTNCSGLSTINIPTSGLTKIGECAFYYCYSLEKIELPESLKSIGIYAFDGCTGLTEIISRIELPFDIDEEVFCTDAFEKTTLYVPIGTINDYKIKIGWKNFNDIQEIGLPIQFEKDGFIFYGLKKMQTATIIAFDSYNDYVEIPSKISYDNIVYNVIGISDSVFANSSVVTIQFPQQIETVGKGLLYNCKELAAIIWEPAFKPSTEFVKNINNPNLLFYVNSNSYVPSNINNVIAGGIAENITLSDNKNNNFYCPEQFFAKSITYTHSYNLKTEKGNAQGWESIVLPFDVQSFKTINGDIIKPVSVANEGEKRFWLREFNTNGFVETSVLKANTPYIIAMPNWNGYQDFYNIQGEIVFSAQNISVEATEIEPITVGDYEFWPSYQQLSKQDGCYVLNKEELYNHLPGSAFINNLRDIKPFEAYLKKKTASAAPIRSISITSLLSGTTNVSNVTIPTIYSEKGIVYINSDNELTCNIYSINGQLVRCEKIKKGTNIIQGLPDGLYYINGKTIIIKQ